MQLPLLTMHTLLMQLDITDMQLACHVSQPYLTYIPHMGMHADGVRHGDTRAGRGGPHAGSWQEGTHQVRGAQFHSVLDAALLLEFAAAPFFESALQSAVSRSSSQDSSLVTPSSLPNMLQHLRSLLTPASPFHPLTGPCMWPCVGWTPSACTPACLPCLISHWNQ